MFATGEQKPKVLAKPRCCGRICPMAAVEVSCGGRAAGWKHGSRRKDPVLSERKREQLPPGETELKRIAAIPIARYRYRGSKTPTPWALQLT